MVSPCLLCNWVLRDGVLRDRMLLPLVLIRALFTNVTSLVCDRVVTLVVFLALLTLLMLVLVTTNCLVYVRNCALSRVVGEVIPGTGWIRLC